MLTTTDLDDYWQRQEHVATLMLPPRDRAHEVFFLWHESRERYGRDHHEIGVSLSNTGECDYVHVKACYYVPRIILTFSPTPPMKSELGEETGEVTDSQVEDHDRHEIAGLQAWYYSDKKTLMLWEVDLFGPYREEDPTRDFLLGSLWHFFERDLLLRFADCEQIITPGWDPKYDGEKWRGFLESRDYAAHRENTFIKVINSETRERL